MKIRYLIVFLTLSFGAVNAQFDKTDGLIIAGYTTAQLNALTAPEGLLVYNGETKSVWFWNGTQYLDLGAVGSGGGSTDLTNVTTNISPQNPGTLSVGTISKPFSGMRANVFNGNWQGDLLNFNPQNPAPTGINGRFYYDSGLNSFRFFENGEWVGLGGGGGTAASTSYDNTNSGLPATNTQQAIDSLDARKPALRTQTEYDGIQTKTPGKLYFIYESGGGGASVFGSGSIYDEATAKFFASTATTETIQLNESANGGQMVISAKPGNYVKTVAAKAGAGTSFVYTKSKLGYVRLDFDDVIEIANGMDIAAGHCLMFLVRVDRTGMDGWSGAHEFFYTPQTDGTNKYMSARINGGSGTIRVDRAGRNAGSPALQIEYIPDNNGWGPSPFFSPLTTNFGFGSEWFWVSIYGKDDFDPVTNYITRIYNGGSTNFQPSNMQAIIAALNGCQPVTGSLYWRKQNAPVYDIDDTGTGIFPVNVTNVDFRLAGTTDNSNHAIDVARMVYLKRSIPPNNLAAICSGAHPLQVLGELNTGEFVMEMGSLPVGATVVSGTPVFNPLDDGPVAYNFQGTNDNELAITINNERVQ